MDNYERSINAINDCAEIAKQFHAREIELEGREKATFDKLVPTCEDHLDLLDELDDLVEAVVMTIYSISRSHLKIHHNVSIQEINKRFAKDMAVLLANIIEKNIPKETEKYFLDDVSKNSVKKENLN